MECEKMRTFDYTKLKERKWDSEILGLVAQIHEFSASPILESGNLCTNT